MTMQNTDRETLKIIFLELLKEDKEFRQAVVKEIAIEGQAIINEEAKREEELKTSIHKIFDKYDDVFKALA